MLYRSVDMENQIVFVLLLVVSSAASAKNEPSYYEDGGTLTLKPPVSEEITSIMWKFKGDMLAEWVKGKVELFYYGTFQTRSTLNTTTGRLEIRNMSASTDGGLYTVEINSQVQSQGYEAKAIKRVPKPTVWIQPVSCTPALDNCTLSCDGDIAEAGPVTYTWRMGDGEWKQGKKMMIIFKTETAHVETFSCQMENPVSNQPSEPKNNPFFVNPPSPVTLIVIVFVVVLLLGGGAGLGYWKRDYLMEKLGRSGTIDVPHAPVNADPEAGARNGGKHTLTETDENIPLKADNEKQDTTGSS